MIDSQSLSGTLGLLMYRAAIALDEGMSHDELVVKLEEWKKKTLIFVNPHTMKNFVRGGRVSKTKGFIAKVLNVKPVISMKNGVADILDKAYSIKANQKMVLRYVEKAIQEKGKIWKYCIVHANNMEGAKLFGAKVEKLTGMAPSYFYNISPVVGVNGGTHTLAVCLLFE